MGSSEEKIIYVYADWNQLKAPQLLGNLYVQKIRGEEIFSFEYASDWLSNKFIKFLDPDLQLFGGRQFVQEGKRNFGIFLDSSPDRWGRLLIKRRESINARKEKRKENILNESDFLLGVFDLQRLGGLRFKLDPNGPFLNNDAHQPIPPISALKTLEHASFQIEQDKSISNKNYEKWLNLILAPGSSLGGARPKAGVCDENNEYWIAKFPSSMDQKNIGAWEMVLHELAAQSGINVPKARLIKLSNRYPTYMSKRFDRISKNKRIHFSSAMTLLGLNDGVNHQEGIGYYDLARFIIQHSCEPSKDLEELWKRILFNILVSNTDDHMRNHGFILTNKGWKLSPAYDMNPNEYGTGLTLNITENSNELNVDLAFEVAEHYKINDKSANLIYNKMLKSIKEWKEVAKTFGIARNEIEFMSNAFKLVE